MSATIEELALPQRSRRRPLAFAGRALRAHPSGAFGVGVLVIVALVAVLAPTIAPHGAHESVGAPYQPPSWSYPLGLDDAGIDMLTVLLWGARASLLVGFTAATIAMLIGGTIGLLAGYFGGKVDAVLMRVTDYALVIPDVPLLLIAAAIWGRSLTSVILIIAILSWAPTARIVRAQAKSLRQRVYVRRARSIGAGDMRIIVQHVLPQVAPVLLTLTVFAISSAILAETAIAFLGLGDPNVVSWGRLIQNAYDGQAISREAWWAFVPPGVAIGTLILACTLIGRALEETIDPRLRSGHLAVRAFRIKAMQLEDRRRS